MKKCFTFLVLLLVFTSKNYAQYTVTQIPYNPDPFTAGTQITLADDQYSAVINLPFSFCFFDSAYTQCVIGSNGLLSFNIANASGFVTWPISAAVPNPSPADLQNCIMGPWQDIDPSVGGTIKYAVNGVAPFRRFVVSFYQIPMFSCNPLLFSEQIIIFETTNVIETHILDKPLCATWNGGYAIHGIQNSGGTTAFTVPGRNYPTQWQAFNDSWKFTPVSGSCVGPPPPNTISGKVFSDLNENCIYDAGDYPVVNSSVLVNGGTYYGWSDVNGDYSIPLDTGNWAVTHNPLPFMNTLCPASGVYNVSFTGSGQTATNRDFGDTASVYCPDLMVDIGTANMTRCLSESVGLVYCNNGNIADSNISITVTLDDSLTLIAASVAYTQSGNNYTFNVGNLMPGQCGYIQFSIDVGCDTVGTVYCMSASISGSSAVDCDSLNNLSTDCHAIIASIDPNGKYVASQNLQQNGWVIEETVLSTDELVYMVTFQNTGNDTAFTVEVRDTLSAFLDPATVIPGAASASYNFLRIGNALTFLFSNIDLPDSNTNEPASHGFIKFRVKQVNGNPDGTLITNDASIYFDQNPPVLTNATENLVCDNPPLAASSIEESTLGYCEGDVVTLYTLGGNPGSGGVWQWTLNDCAGAVVGTGDSITVTVNSADTYYVKANSICGQSECTSFTFSPTPAPVTNFSWIDNNGTVNFSSNSTNTNTWYWDLGDGNTSTDPNPVHTYLSSGTYTVTLMVWGPCGSDTVIQQVNVIVTDVAAGVFSQVKLYPNPNSGQFSLELPAGAPVNLSVTDMYGRVILNRFVEQPGGSISLDLGDAAKGYYLLHLSRESTSHVMPVFVE